VLSLYRNLEPLFFVTKWLSKGFKQAFILILTMLPVLTFAQQVIVVPFNEVYFGDRVGNKTNEADNIVLFSEVGVSTMNFFSQSSSSNEFELQGNDIPGVLQLTMNTGQLVDIDGAIVWNVKSGNTSLAFGFIPAPNTNITIGSGNNAYDILGVDVASGNQNPTNIVIKRVGSSFSPSSGDKIKGSNDSPLDELNQ